MSDANDRKESHSADMLSHVRSSLQKRLGEFADVYMDAKIKIAQKIGDQIAGTSDPEQLMQLSSNLNDVLISTEDIRRHGEKVKFWLTVVDENLDTMISLRDRWSNFKSSSSDSKGSSSHHR